MRYFADLENNILGQTFDKEDSLDNLEEHKSLAKIYAFQENAIAVLSDLKANRSYVYNGALAQELGLSENGTNQEIESVWEDEIYSRIHPEDIEQRHLLELQFFQLLKKTAIQKRTHYRTNSHIRMKNKNGEYIPILHRTLYQQSAPNGSLWLALCIYNFATEVDSDRGFYGVIQNTSNGQIIYPSKERTKDMLSLREIEVLSLIEKGFISKEIAIKLGVSKNTVDRHRQNIINKLRVKNSIEALKALTSNM